jgi:FdrA protein
VRFAFLGAGRPDLAAATADALHALDTDLASAILRISGADAPYHQVQSARSREAPPGGALRGLYSGGTLCDEAMVIASAALGPIASNIPLRPEWSLPTGGPATGHSMIDFGDDAYTRGRPHPMIDNGLRLERLAAEAADPSCGVILLDVVLGHGAHPDPSADLAPAIADAVAGGKAVVVSLVGTDGDPQGLARQADALSGAGAAVFRANADAARHAVALLSPQEVP